MATLEVSREVISLYRGLDASLSSINSAMVEIARVLRRIEKRMEDMGKSNQEIIEEVRQTRGFVASLKATIDGLRQQVADKLSDHEVDDEVAAEVDSLFQEAKNASASIAPAVVANPTTSDPVPSSDTPPEQPQS